MSVIPGTSSRFMSPEDLPPSPIYVFRGHVSEITALQFIRDNTRLVSGYTSILCHAEYSDTDGWIVVWLMISRRPTAVWKGHDAGVLSIREWGTESLITQASKWRRADFRHGRDGKVFVWQFGENVEGSFDTGLPADGGRHRKPWLLHSIDVKEMTFCGIDVVLHDESALIASSSGRLGELVDIHSLPSKTIFCSAIGKDPPSKLGMTMCLSLARGPGIESQFILAAGYESGHACVYSVTASSWSTIYTFKSHSQPVLSLAIHPSLQSFYTTSADADLAQHPTAIAAQPIMSVNTKHSGQTGLRIREDGRIFVTAGWDGIGRVYSATTLRQVAVLKWHVAGLQAAEFSGKSNDKRLIALGGKDAKISLWDIFN